MIEGETRFKHDRARHVQERVTWMNSRARKRSSRLRIAVAQMNSFGSLDENLGRIEELATAASQTGADAVLFPECATTGYGCDFGALHTEKLRAGLWRLAALASRLRINLLVGTPAISGRRLHNALAVFNRCGELVHTYAKCQLTDGDRRWFTPGNSLSLFTIDGICSTAIICHERRYPELVRLPVMAGAQLVFHPNAGMDRLAVSRTKRGGRDGIAVRAFENAVHYIFANTVGPQGKGRWSAGDSKIVAADGEILALASNEEEALFTANVDPDAATRKYATDSLQHPRFLARVWSGVLREIRRRAEENDRRFLRWYVNGQKRARG